MKRTLLGAAVGLLCLGFEPTHSQDMSVFGACSGDDIRVTLEVHDPGSSPNLVGYDLYRRVLGTCTESVRLTDVPWPRQSGQRFTRQFDDAGRDPNVTYQYQIRGVDAQREPVDLYSVYSIASNTHTFANCGIAVIGIGTIRDSDYTLSFEPCLGSCYVPGLVGEHPANLRDYANSGTVLILYGNLVCGSLDGGLLNVDTAVEAACAVPVTAPTWSQVKFTYR